ncbi:RHS repeat-associated core domain-containing protein, partial [Obesumbacterium proteus]
GYPVSVLFERNLSGQINQEQQIVSAPDGSVLWQHRIQHRYDANSALLFTTPDGLPPLHWHTYGPGHLLGVALGEHSLLEFDRDTLHRETQRRFGESLLDTSYTEVGRLHRLTLSTPNADPRAQEYRYTPRGQLSDIISPFSSQHYEYDAAGRLIHERSAHRSTDYHLDLAGNRLINRYIPETFMADMRHPGNRLSEDAHFHYQYDQYGNLSQKISKHDAGEVHHYRYDRSHRLVSYLCYQDGEALRGGRYCYDPLGRRIGKQVMQCNQSKHISCFGWDGDKLVLTERDGTRIHTVYLPHSFVPLLRFEGDKPPTVTPLADKLEQEAGITLPPEFKQTLHHIEQALRANRLSTEQHAWLNQIQLSPDYLTTLLDPLPDTPYAAQLYDCNHLGTPQQLINLNGKIDWSITLDAWGNTLSEENPHQLHQPIRMQGQQYDEESGLHYNRHRYYDPTIGRYITQDPIGLDGGWNLYGYPLNPLQFIDPLGLTQTAQSYVVSRDLSALGDESRSRWNPLTHTFTVTTDSKGNILHTYSWGNSANLKGWNLDQPIDIKTAREALDNNLAQPTLASSSCVEQAYKKLNKKENEHVNLFITRNCKQETNNLLFKAMATCTNNTWGSSPFSPKFGMYGYSY